MTGALLFMLSLTLTIPDDCFGFIREMPDKYRQMSLFDLETVRENQCKTNPNQCRFGLVFFSVLTCNYSEQHIYFKIWLVKLA